MEFTFKPSKINEKKKKTTLYTLVLLKVIVIKLKCPF
jgi:hypothetical protein